AAMLPQVAQTNPLEGLHIAPQADEPMPNPAHAPNVEELIPSPVLEPKIDALEKDLKATKRLNRDTVLLFYKRIKKLEAKVKTKSKRKLVISDSEEEEAAKDYAELEKLISLAEAAVNEPSSFDISPSTVEAAQILTGGKLDPSKISKSPTGVAQRSVQTFVRKRQNKDISPSTVEAAQILTGGKLDPSKISKSPAGVAQRSVQTFVRKRSSKSTQGLDYSDVDFSPRDSVATDSSIPVEKV
nr:hypothetical protein [Tanacetum cinerariifolium]